MNPIILLGSTRSFGHTRQAVSDIIGDETIPIIELRNLTIAPYEYEHPHLDDDFIPTIETLITHDLLIIATPVYWYSMSTLHKIFFDRFNDLLTVRKDLGRKLRGKKLFVIASFGTSYPKGFEETFEQICDYLGMHYLGTSFMYSGFEDLELLANNAHHKAQARKILNLR